MLTKGISRFCASVIASLVIAGLWSASPASAARRFGLFGPEDFVRTKGKPSRVTRQIFLQEAADGYLVVIHNGGSAGQYSRVSSADILVNREKIVGPSRFNQGVMLLEVPAFLKPGENELTVELHGKPGGGLTLAVLGLEFVSPVFPGIVFSAPTNTDELTLAWLPAEDESTPPEDMLYEIHVSETPGFEPTESTRFTRLVGETQGKLTHLSANTSYTVLVVAEDEDGSQSAEREYVTLKTLDRPPVLNSATPIEDAETLGLGEPLVDGTTLTFTPPSSHFSPPTIGAVLVGVDDEVGYLRQVDAVSVSGDRVIVETSGASLSDAVDEISLESNVLLFDVGEAVSSGAKASSSILEPMSRATTRITWNDGLLTASEISESVALQEPSQKAGELTTTASLSFTPALKTKARWSLGTSGVALQEAEVVASGTLSAELAAEYDFSTAKTVSSSLSLFKRTFVSVYTVGPVPIVQVITLSVDATAEATASASVKARAATDASFMVEVGVRWDSATSRWEPVFNSQSSRSFTTDLSVTGGLTGQLALVPKLEIEFYGVIAAELEIVPSMAGAIDAQLATNPACAPLELTAFDFDLGLDCFARASLDILFRNITLFESRVCGPIRSPLFSLPEVHLASGGSPGRSTIPLTATVVNGVNNPLDVSSVEWSVSPTTANVSPTAADLTTVLTCQAPRTYEVTFAGHGILGDLARRCSEIAVACLQKKRLTVNAIGSGSGRVTSQPPGIDCGPVCAADFPEGELVALTAIPDSGSTFVGWSGDCNGTQPSTAVTLDSDLVCQAEFSGPCTPGMCPSGTFCLQGVCQPSPAASCGYVRSIQLSGREVVLSFRQVGAPHNNQRLSINVCNPGSVTTVFLDPNTEVFQSCSGRHDDSITALGFSCAVVPDPPSSTCNVSFDSFMSYFWLGSLSDTTLGNRAFESCLPL